MHHIMTRMANICGILALAIAAAIITPIAQAAGDGKWSLTTGLDYSTGSYGESQDTTITYIPFTGKYATGPWTFGLTIPWIEVEGPGNVVRDLGRLRGTTTSSGTRTESGLGDIIAAATYNLLTTVDGRALDVTGKFKAGTADRNTGLGTGEDDLYVQLDGYRTIDRFTPFATMGYKFLGSPPGVSLNNVFFAVVGSSYKLDDIRSMGLMWFVQQKASDNGSPSSEVTAFYTQKLAPQWKGQLYGVMGFADGSPDLGIGAMVTRSF